MPVGAAPDTLTVGDRVKLSDRAPTAADAKSGLFYAHFRGITGTVQAVYASGEVAVLVDVDSLQDTIARRHRDIQDQMKTKWLDSLSDEARGRLTDQEMDFTLHYTALVNQKDVLPLDTDSGRRSATVTTESTAASKSKSERPSDPASGARATSADLDAAETAELQKRLHLDDTG